MTRAESEGWAPVWPDGYVVVHAIRGDEEGARNAYYQTHSVKNVDDRERDGHIRFARVRIIEIEETK